MVKTDKYDYCDTPVRKSKVSFPDSLIGRAKANDFEMYSGYINITSSPDYLFYWFFSTQDGNSSAPLIIWTNGKFIFMPVSTRFIKKSSVATNL
jgi:carboxypeptidase C (cathepsin A)